MSSHEQVLVVASAAARMLGIVSLPAPGTPLQGTGMVIVTGGAQYRTGSHRQFVQLARTLAAAGFPVLRFDLAGMGDSLGETASFEDCTPHIAAALEALLKHVAQIRQVALLGLCDGASASLLYLQATQDPRISGIALLNPWVRTEEGLARTHVRHYYRDRLLQPAFWRKLLQGRIGWRALRGLTGNVRRMHQQPAAQPDFVARMAQGLQSFSGAVLLLLSERDLTATEFMELAHAHPAWRHLLRSPAVNWCEIQGADHTFSSPAAQQQLEAQTLAWLQAITPAEACQPPAAHSRPQPEQQHE